MGSLLAFLLALPATGQAPEELRLVETSGNTLVLVEGQLFRERRGVRTELGCTSAEGTGRVLELAADPAGLTFVAAEHGLFVLGPRVDVLDPVERLEGAPRGRPSSVYVDPERRVWLATDEGVGTMEPSYFSGRLLTSQDLEGEQRHHRLRGGQGRKLLIQWAGGELVHDAAALPGPRITSLRVDGQELASGTTLERASGGELELELAGEAAGGATFRYRLDGHHVWRALDARARLPVPHPGKHTLEFVALDEDLDRSEPIALHVRVAYPFYYAGGFVVGLATLGALLLLALFLLHGRKTHGRTQPVRAFVSAGLALVLALQVVAGLVPHAKGWPFVGFSMYTRKFVRDEIIYAERMVVLRPGEGGSVWESSVQVQSAGVVVDEPWDVMRPLIDKGAPALRAYLEAWRALNPGAPAIGLQVQACRSRLTRHGPVAIAPLVLAHYREDAGG